MKRLVVLLLAGCMLSACISTGAQRENRVNWGELSANTKVAKVAGIKSLIRPGIY